mmetsp:Transcript_17820/g.37383  ORF Transcript_17820/g.37383 Transcript_17820/m.37383 type:complete len:203 (+) Transcript_17820:968-1576(+)
MWIPRQTRQMILLQISRQIIHQTLHTIAKLDMILRLVPCLPFVLLPNLIRPKVTRANGILHEIRRSRRRGHAHPRDGRQHLVNGLDVPVKFAVQSRRSNFRNGVLTWFQVGLNGRHGIGGSFVIGPEFDDDADSEPDGLDVSSDGGHFGAEGGACCGEWEEGALDVGVVGCEAGVSFLVFGGGSGGCGGGSCPCRLGRGRGG